MLFSSLMFLFVFLPAVLFCYYLAPTKFKNIVLLLFSLFFYGYGEPKSLLVMVVSILMNYTLGLLVARFRDNKTAAKLVVALGVAGNLAVIGYFKYTDFFIDNFNNLFGLSVPLLHVIMPIGISFFTFQGISYIIDVYRESGKVQKNPLNVALYICLFTHLIAGPIVRYETVAEQISNRHVNTAKFTVGIEKFIIGLSKKVLIANSMGYIADQIFAMEPGSMSVVLAWVGVLAYTAQIYFDFSGYSDMGIGLARMFGFIFPENFDYPYIARSVTDYWKRWHISLTTWFRNYLYIPMGGNRVSKAKFVRNMLIVWLLTGFWHGAAWNFIAWGLYFALLLLLERFFLGKYLAKLWRPFQHLYALLLIVLGWLLFRAESMPYALDYLASLFGAAGQPFISDQAFYYLAEYRVEFIVAILASLPIYPLLQHKWRNSPVILLLVKYGVFMALFGVCVIYLVNSTFNPFIYFRF